MYNNKCRLHWMVHEDCEIERKSEALVKGARERETARERERDTKEKKAAEE